MHLADKHLLYYLLLAAYFDEAQISAIQINC